MDKCSLSHEYLSNKSCSSIKSLITNHRLLLIKCMVKTKRKTAKKLINRIKSSIKRVKCTNMPVYSEFLSKKSYFFKKYRVLYQIMPIYEAYLQIMVIIFFSGDLCNDIH